MATSILPHPKPTFHDESPEAILARANALIDEGVSCFTALHRSTHRMIEQVGKGWGFSVGPFMVSVENGKWVQGWV